MQVSNLQCIMACTFGAGLTLRILVEVHGATGLGGGQGVQQGGAYMSTGPAGATRPLEATEHLGATGSPRPRRSFAAAMEGPGR